MAVYRVEHRTVYQYQSPVAASYHSACLHPRTIDKLQTCEEFSLKVAPSTEDLSKRTDYFGNTAHFFSIQQSHAKLTVDSESVVTVEPMQLPLTELTPTCEEVRRFYRGEITADLVATIEYTQPSPFIDITREVREFAQQFCSAETNYLQAVCKLAASIHDEFTFDPTATDVYTPVTKVLRLKRGVCQDYAHLMIAALRAERLPARYVSGYILTEPAEGQERLRGADASHAWVSVFVPQFGWIDVDPTNRQFVNEEHVRVGFGRDFSDVSMLRGAVTGGGKHSLGIEVTMTPEKSAQSERLELPVARP